MKNFSVRQFFKYFFMMDFISGFKIGLRYFFKPKVTLNYPHEKGILSPRFRADVDLTIFFYEKVLFFTQLTSHLMCKLLKKS